MDDRRIIMPNGKGSFIVEEIRQRLEEGHTVRISFGGTSMLPMIDGRTNILVHLEPLQHEPQVGDICLFLFEGQCVIHRLLRVKGEEFVFRGDNCMREEHVRRDAVMARLKAIEYSDGRIESCDTSSWRRRSRRVSIRRTLANGVRRALSRSNRRWMRWVYFALLVILMWAPLGFVGIPLNNFVFGIRLDHLIHASVYIPCAFFLMDYPFASGRRRSLGVSVWLVGAVIGILTETVQYMLPYRGFDINDLVANFLGVTIGWLIIRILKK